MLVVCVGGQPKVAMVGNERGQCIDQAKPPVGSGQQQNAAVGTDPAAVERGGELLLANAWQREWQQGIVSSGGNGSFCPGAGVGVSTHSLCDFRRLYHAHQRTPAML